MAKNTVRASLTVRSAPYAVAQVSWSCRWPGAVNDVASNVTQSVDANANAVSNPVLGTTSMTYDTLNRPVGRSYSDGTPAVSWTYDAQGRRASMTDGSGVTTYGYDAGNRVISIAKGAVLLRMLMMLRGMSLPGLLLG